MFCLKFCVDAACVEKIGQGYDVFHCGRSGPTFNAKCTFRHRMLAGTYFCVRIKALAKEGFWDAYIVLFNLGAD